MGKTTRIKIKIDDVEANLKFLIVSNTVQKVPIIVGQPFTDRRGVIVQEDDEKLTFFKKR